ncbi:apolipoprotein C-I isoform X2 [Petaurus breviceps papuanus]|uniref:apolipoprotein C-I isoform X2 n=1 Tax=Petaurus breviceps papuanus TaxID=3040969 RepID=UPI0036DA82B8
MRKLRKQGEVTCLGLHRHPLITAGPGPSHPYPTQPAWSQFCSDWEVLLSSPCTPRAPSSPVMKPFLSFTVLAILLYFLAEGPSPAQASSNVAESFQQIPEKIKEFADNVANSAKDFFTKTRNWFKQNFQKIREKMD